LFWEILMQRPQYRVDSILPMNITPIYHAF
jgi:hypothetical protein